MESNELTKALIELNSLVKKLEFYWANLNDDQIREATEVKHLPCDACEEEEDDYCAI